MCWRRTICPTSTSHTHIHISTLVLSPDHTLHYVKVGLVTLVNFLALTFFSAGICAEPIRLQDSQLLCDRPQLFELAHIFIMTLAFHLPVSIKAAFYKARIPEFTAVVLPDFRTDSLATVRQTKSGLNTLVSCRHVEETSTFWQVDKAEQTTGTSTGTYSVAIVLISNWWIS